MQLNNSIPIIYGIIAGMLPSFLWLWFWLKEDNLHDEPRKTLAACFLLGMGVVFIAIPFEWLNQNIFPNANYQYIGVAVIEEFVKFGAAFVLVFWSRKMFEPVDAMIYMVTVALGFAAMENTLFLLGIVNSNTNNILAAIITGNLRFIGSTLLHIIASGSVGFMIAATYYHGKFIKFLSLVVGLAVAVSLHAAFDLAIINSNPTDTLKVYTWVWAGVIVLFILFQEAKGVELRHNDTKKNPAAANKQIKA